MKDKLKYFSTLEELLYYSTFCINCDSNSVTLNFEVYYDLANDIICEPTAQEFYFYQDKLILKITSYDLNFFIDIYLKENKYNLRCPHSLVLDGLKLKIYINQCGACCKFGFKKIDWINLNCNTISNIGILKELIYINFGKNNYIAEFRIDYVTKITQLKFLPKQNLCISENLISGWLLNFNFFDRKKLLDKLNTILTFG